MSGADNARASKQPILVGARVLQVGRCYHVTLDLPEPVNTKGTCARLVIEGVGDVIRPSFIELTQMPAAKPPPNSPRRSPGWWWW